MCDRSIEQLIIQQRVGEISQSQTLIILVDIQDTPPAVLIQF